MGDVLLEVNAEELGDLWCGVGELEEDVTCFRETLNWYWWWRWSLCRWSSSGVRCCFWLLSLTIFSHLWQERLLAFLNLYQSNLIRTYVGLNIHFIIAESRSIFMMVLLLKYVKNTLFEIVCLIIPDLSFIKWWWQQDPHVVGVLSALLVVNNNDELLGVVLSYNWTFWDCIILHSSAVFKIIVDFKTIELFHKLLQILLINLLSFLLGTIQMPWVIIGHILLSSSCDGIMMLDNTKLIQEFIVWFNYCFDIFFWSWLMYGLSCKQFTLSVVLCICIFNLLFKSRSWCEEATPVWILVGWIWKEIICLDWPVNILRFQSIDKCLWSWHYKLHIVGVVLVTQINHQFNLFKTLPCILKSEIVTNLYENIFCCFVFGCDVNDMVYHLVCTELAIIVWQGGIILDWSIVVVVLLKLETFWCTVIIPHDMAEDLFIISEVLLEWSPQKCHGCVVSSLLTFSLIQSWNENSIKSKICKQCCISCWMAKWINHPTNSWNDAEFIFQKVMSHIHIVNHVFIVWACFISSTPSAHCYLKLAILNKLLRLLPYWFICSSIPHLKVLHLNVCKLSIWMTT